MVGGCIIVLMLVLMVLVQSSGMVLHTTQYMAHMQLLCANENFFSFRHLCDCMLELALSERIDQFGLVALV